MQTLLIFAGLGVSLVLASMAGRVLQVKARQATSAATIENLNAAGVEQAYYSSGGKLIQPTTDIGPHGTIALIADRDGNVVGLHTTKASS